ncbi:MAG: discoidin domain-containing protein [Gammaproteobacteria bacterium]|nr:discoidin domain-containing protein [Gammaproteobacteria bacterium]
MAVTATAVLLLNACNGSGNPDVTTDVISAPTADTYTAEYRAADYSTSPDWYTRVSVAQENLLSGSGDWKIMAPACNPCTDNIAYNEADAKQLYAGVAVQGYASKTSVNPGEPITFFVSTGSPTGYTMSFFRIGWYAGAGARLVLGPVSLQGNPQPVPDPGQDGLIECHWPAAYTLTVPETWVSGVYLAKLETAAGQQSYIIFVVRDDSRPSAYLFISSVNTYQAYNEWGGSSLYTRFKSGPLKDQKTGYRVSFDRPYWRGEGSGDFLSYEINMLRWLEREGLDVTYVTDTDLDAHPGLLLKHKAILIVGHGEYWSWRMRANLERARDQGVSLGFFSGNSVYWQARYAADAEGEPERRLIAFKEDVARRDPYATGGDKSRRRYATGYWSDLENWKVHYTDLVNRPEEALIGAETERNGNCCTSQAKAIGDIAVTAPAGWPAWLSQSTGLYAGAVLPDILGYEVDAVHGHQPVNTVIVARSRFPKTLSESQQIWANATVYTAPSGAVVFAAGSIDWDLGLDDFGRSRGSVPGVQQLTRNFLDRALQTASPLPRSSVLPATVSAVASPVNGLVLDLGTARWVQQLHWRSKGTAALAALTNYAVEISTDGLLWQTIIVRHDARALTASHELLNEQARYVRLIAPQADASALTPADFSEFWAQGAPPPPSARLPALGGGPIAGGSFTGYAIDLGARQQITRIGWRAVSNNAQPLACTVQVSDNGNSWRTVLQVRTLVFGQQTLALSAQGRYLRIQIPPIPDTQFHDLWAEGSSVSAVLGAQASAKSEAAGYPAGNAVDGADKPWLANLAASPDNNNTWLQLDFGSRRQIDRLQWSGADGSPYNAESPSDYSIQVSDDALTWKTVLARSNTKPLINGDELLNTQGRYLRLVVSKVGDGSGWPLALFAIWAEGY